ncbi:MAG: 2-C-methyl-D-erythritol 4-phosphate cytidylyltransferase [Bacteroidales bacterium]|nr:MAG: 2-C-methyl-D-erythritol 4-phosphate cytidylyltransferase [Bacteroidales bacterium]
MSAQRIAIVVAGGTGARMGTDIPKQFLLLQGEPILMHTLWVFKKISSIEEIILVLPQSQIEYWYELCKKHQFKVDHSVVEGGDTRFESVSNGLAKVNNPEALVAIHDGVRPFVSVDVIENCFNAAKHYGSAIPVIKPVESVRLLDGSSTRPFDREKVYLVQTPQVFRASIIKRCYKTAWQPSFTDDASVAEFLGEKIHLVEGNRENIKITTPLDMKIAEALINP